MNAKWICPAITPFCEDGTIDYESAGRFYDYLIADEIDGVLIGGSLGSYLRVLLPSGGLGGSNALLYALTDFEFLKVGPLSVWTPWLLLIVPALEIPLFLFLTVHTYCRRSM